MMEPVEPDLFDLPDYEHTQDETFQPLPPPDSPGGAAEEALVNGGPEGSQLPQSKDFSVTTRRTVKRTMPKLDAQRLVSERGLPALRSLFDNIKFKGKGHEEADLKCLISHMEHWAHRLFPQLQFEDVVDRIETLGTKKPVQVCLKKIRLDLPLLHEDFISNEGEDEGSSRLNPAAEEPDFFSETQNSRELPGSSSSPALIEEQQQRTERNRQIAIERRQAKTQFSQSQDDDFLKIKYFLQLHPSVITQVYSDFGANDVQVFPAASSLELPTNESSTTLAQEKNEVCIDTGGIPFQATEKMQNSVDQ